jgi:hypothetical protein
MMQGRLQKESFLLVVIESKDDRKQVEEYYDIFEDRAGYKSIYWDGFFYGKITICAAREVGTTLCGMQFHAVRFWEGMYSSGEIMYALSRQRLI